MWRHEDLCVGGPHIRHDSSFTLKVMNIRVSDVPCEDVTAHTLYGVPRESTETEHLISAHSCLLVHAW